jgi:predicted transcriptional regulator
MAYRDKIELVASILKAVNGRNVSAVQIMYKAFLSYTKVKQYVPILIDAGLIKYHQGNLGAYRITDKGLSFLHLHNEISELVTNLKSNYYGLKRSSLSGLYAKNGG